MRRAAVVAMLVAVLALREPATAAPEVRATPQTPPEPPQLVLAKYFQALDALTTPKLVRFEYAVEQAGFHDLVQTHRIYRSGPTERDEILSVDGQPLAHPSVRIIRHRVDRYSIAAVTPRPLDYAFTYTGLRQSNGHYDYVFATERREPGTFAIHSITVNGARYLPSQINFTNASSKLRAQGRLTYGAFDQHWMVTEAVVTARFEGKVARERIVWSRYEFPASLPASTFIEKRVAPSAAP